MKKHPLLAIVILALGPAALCSQAPAVADEAQMRASCRLAAQVVRTGHPHPRRDWAMSFIVHCPDSGPPALAVAWQLESGDDRGQLGLLVGQTERLRDGRLAHAVMTVATSPAYRYLVRLSALRVLVSYWQAGKTVSLETLEAPPAAAPPVLPYGCCLGDELHFAPVDGAVPIDEGTRAEIVSALRDMVTGDPDERVRAAAAFVLGNLEALARGG